MEIFYLQYESIPSKESDSYEDAGGAFINCWIKSESMEAAKNTAEQDIKNNNWVVLKLEESYPVSIEYYDEGDESLEYYQQAEVNGEVYVYHSWPNESQVKELIQ